MTLGVGSASAGSFSYPPRAAFPTGSATAADSIFLGTSSNGGFIMNFVLPQDYETNGKVQIVLYGQVNAPGNCNMRLVPTDMVRRRLGALGAGGLNGLTAADGSANFFLPNAGVFAKVFNLKVGDLVGQRRGDGFAITFERQPAHADDTCSFGSIVNIDIRYPTAAAP